MMTLDEAILHAEAVADRCAVTDRKCEENHRQLAEWLRELKEYRESRQRNSVRRRNQMRVTWTDNPDDEIWMNGPFDSEEEAIENARGCGHEGEIWLADCEPYEIPGPDIDSLLERLEEDAYEEMGEVMEDWNPSHRKGREEAWDQLEKEVGAAVDKYLEATCGKPEYFKCVNIRKAS